MVLALAASAVLHSVGGVAGTQLSIVETAPESASPPEAWNNAGASIVLMEPYVPPPPLDEAAPEPQQPIPEESLAASQPPEAPEPPPPLDLRLGIDGSTADSSNMLGFREATPHSARKSEIDQPALDPDAGQVQPPLKLAGAPDAQPAPPSPLPPRPIKATTAREDTESRPEIPPIPTVQPLTAMVGPPITLAENPYVPGPALAGANGSDRVGNAASRPGASGQPGQAATSPPPSPHPTARPGEGGESDQSRPEQTADPDRAKAPGLRSESESDPTSKTDPIEIRFGQTVAGDGIEIVTRRPRQPVFSKLTRVVAWPTNPVVAATFDASGTVVEVKIVKTSGFDDVDQPVLNMVYSWRATGPRLESLAKTDPNARFTLRFAILLR